MTMRKGGIIQETMDRSEVQVENIPVYRHSAEYAVQHGEAFSYYESFDANQKCAAAIEKAVEDNYRDNHLDSRFCNLHRRVCFCVLQEANGSGSWPFIKDDPQKSFLWM